MEEHRKLPRMRTLKAAKIAFRGGASVLDCTVRNVSKIGACLDVASPVGVPERFDLIFDSDNAKHPCRVVWRSTHRIGVAFS
jgi:hypothetical protein